MQANAPVEARSNRPVVVLYGLLVAATMLFLGLAFVVTWLSIEREYRTACIVSVAATIPASLGLLVLGSTALRHQVRPMPRPLVRDRVRWAPTLGIRLGVGATLAGLTTSIAALAVVRPMGPGWWIGLAFVWLVGLRLVTARLIADREGIRCSVPLGELRLRWDEIERLEARGTSTFGQRIVAVTVDGRERMLWVFDSRVPVAPTAADLLLGELETVRRHARSADGPGVDPL
jgi:hypothetical protein